MIKSSSFRATRVSTITALTAFAVTSGAFLFSSNANAQTSPAATPTPPVYSRVLVFGDSLSDVGNLRHRMEDDYSVGYPGGDYNYSDGRFTNSSDTSPGSNMYAGVWHEQLSRTFFHMASSTPSLDGGDDFAFGGATTEDGTKDFTVFGTPFGDLTVTIDNMGKQVDDYLTRRTLDPAALFAVWGGGNDIINDDSSSNVTAAAARMAMLVSRMAQKGAKHFIVPNVPPLGGVPRYKDDEATQLAKDKASADYRAELDADLNATIGMLAAQGIQIDVGRLDIWSLFVRFVSDPARYGFTNSSDSAQDQSVNPDDYLFWDDLHPTTSGHYQIALEANRVLTGAAVAPGRAVNLSTRAFVSGGENAPIGGFIITGSNSKRVLLRGIGPSLTQMGVSDALPNPRIELFDAQRNSLATNGNWRDTQEAEIVATGAAPTNDLESAMVQTLAPGSYTIRLTGAAGGTGVGLVEIYDLDSATNSSLANVSTRGFVGLGDDVMIAGVIIAAGGDPITVVRALGPSLTSAGVVAALQDPTVELYNENGEQIAANDNWRDGQSTAAKSTLLQPSDDRESTIVISLAPGNYTAVVRGQSSATGVALVEVYRIP